jgi:ATP-dependent DNA helicase RecQ
MDAAVEFIASFNRENLFIRVVPKDDPDNQTLQFIKKFPNQSGIIYCFSRNQVDDLYERLKGLGYSVKPYHAGLPESERNRNQELFTRDDVQIIVATIAFGMGIDKENIRFVLHYDLPQNIESFYQEMGRGGRDGLRSDCLLLFGYGDIQKIKHFINKKEGHEKRVAGIHLNAMLRFGEADECRRIPLINYFGEEYSQKNCRMCDNCLTGETVKKDMTVLAQKFLSCVKRSGEIFGANHIIDVLRGSKAQKVFKFSHQHLSTYGIGLECSRKQWIKLARQFINKGLLMQDGDFGSLKLTEKGWAVLKGEEIVMGRLAEENSRDLLSENDDTQFDLKLFDIMRKKRKELADATHVPPYIIFSDKTLAEMASYYPQNRDALMAIHGVGKIKYENYGQIFIELIRGYCRQHQVEEDPPKALRKAVHTAASTQKLRYMVIGDAFNSGRSIPDIMTDYNIKLDTVLNHLYRYLIESRQLKAEGFLSLSPLTADQRALVFDTFDRLGAERLGPVYRNLERQISYEDLKLLRLHYLTTQIQI